MDEVVARRWFELAERVCSACSRAEPSRPGTLGEEPAEHLGEIGAEPGGGERRACNHCRVTTVAVTHFTDPACPWAYSASPALAVLRWRYREQLDWRLGDDRAGRGCRALPRRTATRPSRMTARAACTSAATGCRSCSSPARAIARQLARLPGDRRHAAARPARASTRRCARCSSHGSPPRWCSTRTTTSLRRSRAWAAWTSQAVVAAIDDEPHDRRLRGRQGARRARPRAGPTHFQGKARQTDGPVRYSAPSLVFESDGRRLEAGRLSDDRGLRRADRQPRPRARAPRAARGAVGGARCASRTALSPQELAAIMAHNNEAPDRDRRRAALIELAGAGAVRRTALGDDALWQLA